MSTWHCVTCDRYINHQGVPQHRAAHARRKEGPIVMETYRYRYTYDYRDQVPGSSDPSPTETPGLLERGSDAPSREHQNRSTT